jgi:glutathione S-transferase
MTAKITVYTFPPSYNGIRPVLALLEKGLAYDRVPINIFGSEDELAPLLELTPRGQIPTLVYADENDPEGHLVLYESVAIIRFLDDMYPDPPLMPPTSEPHRRAEALVRLEEFQQKLDPKNIFGSVVVRRMGREELGPRIDALTAELARWDKYVEGRNYLAGDQFTLADIAVFPLLFAFSALGFDYEHHTPSLASYVARCRDRRSVVESGWVETFHESLATRAPKRVLAD